MLEPLLRTAAAVGISLDVSSSKALADSLDHAVVRLPFACLMTKLLSFTDRQQSCWACFLFLAH